MGKKNLPPNQEHSAKTKTNGIGAILGSVGNVSGSVHEQFETDLAETNFFPAEDKNLVFNQLDADPSSFIKNPNVDIALLLDSGQDLSSEFLFNTAEDYIEPKQSKVQGSILNLDKPVDPHWFFTTHRQKTPKSAKNASIYRVYMGSLSKEESGLYDESIGYRPVFDTEKALACAEELYAKFPAESAGYDYVFDRIFSYGGRRKSVQPNEALYGALDSLKQQFPQFSEVLDSIYSYFLLKQFQAGKNEPKMQPILLNGPSGVGKTHFFNALADALCLYKEVLNISTVTASFVLTGSDPRWHNGSYGAFLSVAIKSKTSNPMIMLDEIDKITTGHDMKFPVANALIELLEPESSKRMKDESFGLEFDASNWLIFAASNDASKLPPYLYNRFNVFDIRRPEREARLKIYESMLGDEFPEIRWEDKVLEIMSDESIDFRSFKNKSRSVVASVLRKKGVPSKSERPLVITVFDLKASGVQFKKEL